MNRIKSVKSMQVLDSRGNPTVQVKVILEDGTEGISAVPSGASTGSFEAIELRDNDKNKYVLQNKDRLIVLCEHADCALIFQFKVYVNSPDYWNAQYSLLEEVKKSFDKNKISIPYPQMDIHLDKK